MKEITKVEVKPTPKEVAKMKEGYIKVTESGVAIVLDSSPPEIKGCYTEGLQSCIAVILVGNNGFALIHDTGELSGPSIAKVCSLLGVVNEVRLHYNANLYSDGYVESPQVIFKVEQMLTYVDNSQTQTFKTVVIGHDNEEVIVSRNLVCTPNWGDEQHKIPESVIFPKDMGLRERINRVNGFFLADAEKVNADIQFDGSSFTDHPSLNKNRTQISALSTDPKFSSNSRIADSLLTRAGLTRIYLKAYQEVATQLTAKTVGSVATAGVETTIEAPNANLWILLKGKINKRKKAKNAPDKKKAESDIEKIISNLIFNRADIHSAGFSFEEALIAIDTYGKNAVSTPAVLALKAQLASVAGADTAPAKIPVIAPGSAATVGVGIASIAATVAAANAGTLTVATAPTTPGHK
jgi:hypothetical protein